MFVTNWNSTTKIQKISEITNFFRHYFLSRTEVFFAASNALSNLQDLGAFCFLATQPNFLINDLKREISLAGTSNVYVVVFIIVSPF